MRRYVQPNSRQIPTGISDLPDLVSPQAMWLGQVLLVVDVAKMMAGDQIVDQEPEKGPMGVGVKRGKGRFDGFHFSKASVAIRWVLDRRAF
jgi:hypothetical protein